MESATMPIKKMYGNMIRVKKIVIDSFSGDSANPGAITRMIIGDSKTPMIAAITSNTESSLMADLAISKASSFPWFVR
jgi:hypothetical protein